MLEHYEEKKKFLPGLGKDMPETYGKLAEIFQYQVFELYEEVIGPRNSSYYIPYMMNDALECYLVLKDARITGEYLQLDPEEFPLQAQIAQRDGQTALIVKQGSENVFYDLVPGNRGIVPVLSISQDRTFLGGRAGTLASAGVYDRNDL